MMNPKRFQASALLAVAALLPLAANAAVDTLVLNPSGPGMLSASFERGVSGLFLDTYTFTPSALTARVAVSLQPVNGVINFTSALLNGEGFSFLPESGAINFDIASNVDVGTPLTLTLLGFSGDAETLTGAPGRYAGSVIVDNITAVIPEPATFASMALGLAGLLGVGAARRRRDGCSHHSAV